MIMISLPNDAAPSLYPAECHFRIIAEAGVDPSAALTVLLEDYQVTAPLVAGNSSCTGKYRTFELSVLLQSREEMDTLDGAIRSVQGVRILL